jgi:hypothetical protein
MSHHAWLEIPKIKHELGNEEYDIRIIPLIKMNN